MKTSRFSDSQVLAILKQSEDGIELSVKACEKSAARAQEVYTEAARLVSKLEGSYIMWIVIASLLSAMAVATPVMLILR